MALKSTKTLTTSDGMTVAVNNIIAFKTVFEPRVNRMDISLFIWSSEANYNDTAKSCISNPCTEIKKYTFSKNLTQEDFTALTPLAANQYVKAEVESWDASWANKLTIM